MSNKPIKVKVNNEWVSVPNIQYGGSSSSGGSSNVYSEGETVIGTWVDEKPIYRDVSLLALGNLVPVLTGESSKVICNNSPYAGNAAWMVFDDKISTTYGSPDNPGVIYLGYRFDEPQLVLKYALTATDPTSVRNWPTDFKLQGSNDEITWDTLDEQVGFVGFDSSSGPHEFDVNNSTYYKAYRIEVTKRGSGGTGVGGLARLEFHGYKDMVPPENTDIIFRQESFSNYQVYEYTKTTD